MTVIVIPAADVVPDADQLLGTLLSSIEVQKIHEQWATVVCFDACKPDFTEVIKHKFPFIISLINNRNRTNFAGNANMGLRYAHKEFGEDAVVVNQDCILPSMQHLRHLPGEGISVATQVTMMPEPPLDLDKLAELNLLSPDEPTRTKHDKLIGFFMHFSKKLMDRVGYFDEYFRATFDDDDICARALLAGFPVEHVDIAVHHYISRCGSYDAQALGVNIIKFRTKWSIPPSVPHAEFNHWIKTNHVWMEQMKEP